MNSILKLFSEEEQAIVACFTDEEQDELTYICLRYMFKLCSFRDFKADLFQFDSLKSDNWRRALNKSVCAIRIKLWIRWYAVHGKVPMRDFGLSAKTDKTLLRVLARYPDLLVDVGAIEGVTFSWEKYQRVMGKIVLSLNGYARHRVWHKLRFLFNDSGLDSDDFTSELLAAVISGLYSQYPRYKSYLHASNVGRTIINRISVNLIHHYTSQGRRNKYMGVDGLTASYKVSLDALTENAASDMSEGAEYAPSTTRDECARSAVELVSTISKLSLSPSKAKVLHLLYEEDEGFSQYLRDKVDSRIESNLDYRDSVLGSKYSKYYAHIAEYTGYSTSSIKGLVSRFEDYRSRN